MSTGRRDRRARRSGDVGGVGGEMSTTNPRSAAAADVWFRQRRRLRSGSPRRGDRLGGELDMAGRPLDPATQAVSVRAPDWLRSITHSRRAARPLQEGRSRAPSRNEPRAGARRLERATRVFASSIAMREASGARPRRARRPAIASRRATSSAASRTPPRTTPDRPVASEKNALEKRKRRPCGPKCGRALRFCVTVRENRRSERAHRGRTARRQSVLMGVPMTFVQFGTARRLKGSSRSRATRAAMCVAGRRAGATPVARSLARIRGRGVRNTTATSRGARGCVRVSVGACIQPLDAGDDATSHSFGGARLGSDETVRRIANAETRNTDRRASAARRRRARTRGARRRDAPAKRAAQTRRPREIGSQRCAAARPDLPQSPRARAVASGLGAAVRRRPWTR